MEHDSGRTAMWICSAIIGMLRHKGIMADGELDWLAGELERHADVEPPEQQADMRRAAQWLRHSIPAAND